MPKTRGSKTPTCAVTDKGEPGRTNRQTSGRDQRATRVSVRLIGRSLAPLTQRRGLQLSRVVDSPNGDARVRVQGRATARRSCRHCFAAIKAVKKIFLASLADAIIPTAYLTYATPGDEGRRKIEGFEVEPSSRATCSPCRTAFVGGVSASRFTTGWGTLIFSSSK